MVADDAVSGRWAGPAAPGTDQIQQPAALAAADFEAHAVVRGLGRSDFGGAGPLHVSQVKVQHDHAVQDPGVLSQLRRLVQRAE
ncbi:hypothetical protein GCM10009839_58870 [Catenulispora yoronensis]|uniref:Uncharacterized protein n=1 Tax=Catenulispora yoronensis TaxID=450799 RepID=A0ABP5GJM1_9ACTN